MRLHHQHKTNTPGATASRAISLAFERSIPGVSALDEFHNSSHIEWHKPYAFSFQLWLDSHAYPRGNIPGICSWVDLISRVSHEVYSQANLSKPGIRFDCVVSHDYTIKAYIYVILASTAAREHQVKLPLWSRLTYPQLLTACKKLRVDNAVPIQLEFGASRSGFLTLSEFLADQQHLAAEVRDSVPCTATFEF
jgi:hypothetical protein